MKGIKVGIVGVCFCLLGIAFSTNNVLAYGSATIGLVVAIIGCSGKSVEYCRNQKILPFEGKVSVIA